MKRIASLLLTLALLFGSAAVPTAAIDSPSFTVGAKINIKSSTGLGMGDDAGHGNHQTRTVHTSHGDYAAYITGTYTDSDHQTVNQWTLFKMDPATGSAKAIYTGEKYYDSSQVSLLVDKDENVWAITSTSDSRRNYTSEALDCRAYRIDAETDEVTKYASIITSGGAKDGYGYASCFYDRYKDRIVVMHAGGDYVKGQKAASLNWTIFDMKTNTWQNNIRSKKIEARHCYMFGYIDENGGLMIIAQRDIKAASLGYPEIGNNNGLYYEEQQYMQQHGITRWSANYCWDQLDLYYFPKLTESRTMYEYSVCPADYSRVIGTQEERYTLEKRLSNYYPAIMNNNGGDFLLTQEADGRRLLHITYNKAYIQAAMDRSKGTEATWYYQVWDVSNGSAAVKLFDGPITVNGKIADDIVQGGGFSFRLYEDSKGNVNLISAHNGELSVYRTEYNGSGGYSFVKVGSSVSVSKMGDLINISSQRGGSVTDDKINVLYTNSSGSYVFTQISLSPVEYEAFPCAHSYTRVEDLSTAPTCTEVGSDYLICSWCNGSTVREVPATGHSETTATVPPTCTEDGYTLTVCSVCGYESTVIIDKKGHTFVTGSCLE
ncbi:MAG: hypothetical protein IKL24_00090, partial [Clostridia bacterium]|nr:hypothetical protein [Clostridia bacterium]